MQSQYDISTQMEPALRALVEFLSRRTGLCLAHDRDSSLAEGVRRAMVRVGQTSVEDYFRQIQIDQTAFDDLMADVTVGETYFFREPGQFQALRETILPEIQARKGRDHFVRIWSAACSTGEEPWSVSMLCEQAGLGDNVRILATDISRQSLLKAETGRYRKWSLRGPSQELAGDFLSQTADGWKIRDSLRSRVSFDYLNLALDNYPSLATGTWGCDVILCRNVLIYFDRPTIKAVLNRLYDSLSPGGWLILASTDPPANTLAPFELVEAGDSLVYRRPLEPGSELKKPLPAAPEFDEWVFDEPDSTTVDSTIIRSTDTAIQNAQSALQYGDVEKVRQLTESERENPIAAALLIRALAMQDTARAEQACAVAADLHATSEEIHYLHGVLLLDLRRHMAAQQAIRRALFLNRKLTIAHFTLGVIMQRSGQRQSAIKAFKIARRLCEALPSQSVVPLSDGEHAGRLAQMAGQHLAMLEENS